MTTPRASRTRLAARVLISAAVAALVGLSGASGTVVAAPPQPRGVFSLTAVDAAVPADILDNPLVTGISLRQRWGSFEAVDGGFDYSYLDAQIARVAAAGKVAHLRVMHGGTSIPQWVLSGGVQIFVYTDNNKLHDTYHQQVIIPVPWDPRYLQLKTRAIAALGARYNANPAIAYVGTACANAASDDWFLPTTPRDITSWRVAGYTTSNMISACMQVIDATAAAFPDKVMAMAVGPTSAKLDPDAHYVARTVIAYARSRYPGRFIVQKNSLSAAVPDPSVELVTKPWKVVYDSRPDVAGQMLWYVTDDPNCRMNGNLAPCDPATVLRDAVATGFHYGMKYLEIYQRDVRNPALQGVLRYAVDALMPPSAPTGLTGQVVSSTRINLFWTPAADVVGVVGYRVYRGTTLVGITFTNAFADTGLRGERSYTYRVSAFDAPGNESDRSAPLTLTTP